MARGDRELFKDKIEVSLDGRQVFYLFFGGAVIASLVFVLGVMVGKRVEARGHVATTAATSAALDPLAALDQLGRGEGEALSFPAALSGDPEVAGAPLGAVEQAIREAKPPGDPVSPAPAMPAAKPAAEPARPAAKPAVELAKPEPVKVTADPVPPPDDGGDSAKSPNKYTLQLSSFQDRGEAEAFHGELASAGYTAYIVEAEVPGRGTWYRVRLGSYDSYGDAIAAKKAFEDKQKMIAYVTKRKR